MVAEEPVGEVDELFGVVGRVCFGRVGESVGDAVVDGLDAGGVRVAQPGCLDGGGFPGEGGEVTFPGVSAEVDEDVDFVAGDLLGELVVVQACDLMPFVGEGSESVGHRVGSEGGGVADVPDVIGVVAVEDGLEEVGAGVDAKVVGNVADPQGPVGIGSVGVHFACPFGRGVSSPVAEVFLVEDFRFEARQVVEVHQEVGMDLRVLPGGGADGPGHQVQGFGGLSLHAEDISKVAEHAGVIGCECAGLLEVVPGLGDFTGDLADQAQFGVAAGVGMMFDDPLADRPCLGVAAEMAESFGRCVDVFRQLGGDLKQQLAGPVEFAVLEAQFRKRQPDVGVVGVELGGSFGGLFGFIVPTCRQQRFGEFCRGDRRFGVGLARPLKVLDGLMRVLAVEGNAPESEVGFEEILAGPEGILE